MAPLLLVPDRQTGKQGQVNVSHATPIKKLNAVTANTPICRQLNTEDV